MFFFIGIFMTVVQGGYSRRIKQGKHIRSAYIAILLLIPSFIIIALAGDQMKFYLGLMLYSYSSAVVVPCLTTVTSNYGNDDEKGTITGIVRSLGALARAFGPIFTSMSNLFSSISINLVKTTTKETFFFILVYWTFGSSFAYILGSVGLLIPLCILIRTEARITKQSAKVE